MPWMDGIGAATSSASQGAGVWTANNSTVNWTSVITSAIGGLATVGSAAIASGNNNTGIVPPRTTTDTTQGGVVDMLNKWLAGATKDSREINTKVDQSTWYWIAGLLVAAWLLFKK